MIDHSGKSLNIVARSGDLTSYGLACGYTQSRFSGPVKVTLWKEHGTFHVRGVYYKGDRQGERAFWLSYPTVKAARKCFYEAALVKKRSLV